MKSQGWSKRLRAIRHREKAYNSFLLPAWTRLDKDLRDWKYDGTILYCISLPESMNEDIPHFV